MRFTCADAVPGGSSVTKADEIGHTPLAETNRGVDDFGQQLRDSSHSLPCRMRPEDVQSIAIALCRCFGDVIVELHDLLEQYGPPWYTEQQHDRAERAIRLIKCLSHRSGV